MKAKLSLRNESTVQLLTMIGITVIQWSWLNTYHMSTQIIDPSSLEMIVRLVDHFTFLFFRGINHKSFQL